MHLCTGVSNVYYFYLIFITIEKRKKYIYVLLFIGFLILSLSYLILSYYYFYLQVKNQFKLVSLLFYPDQSFVNYWLTKTSHAYFSSTLPSLSTD